ncbi:hypothetical protein C1646_756957 [Rhizophagus diaphanus]|nr:hypothetical protein C1646_756957 [Rhizophagus diaphanus] [Rhizophagus sp. MUCL 43196]
MNSSTAANILYSIFDFLSKDNIMLSENENDQDYEAMKLLPERYEYYICIKSSPDGNCFFKSASLIDIIYRNEIFNNENIIINDYALVLYRSVESLFPDTNSKYMNQIYNRIILPRENKDNLPQCITIMWSSYSVEQFKISYQANHFMINYLYIQDYLSITEDCNKPIIDQEEYKKLVIEDQNYNVNIVKDQEYKKPVKDHIEIVKDRNEYKQLVKDHFNYKERDQNSALLGLLMDTNDAFVPNVKIIDGCLIYEEAQDFQFNIT